MEKRELICIGCPMGCPLTVELENGEIKTTHARRARHMRARK